MRKSIIAAGALCANMVAVAGCVADVGENDGDGAGGASTTEDVGEAVSPVALNQCLAACKEGADYFNRLFCPKVGPVGTLMCVLAATNARDICRGPCRDGMEKHECETNCCDAGANALEDYCAAAGVPQRLRRECETVARNAGGVCNKTCK